MSNQTDRCEVNCIHHEIVSEVRSHMVSDQIADRLAETFKAMGDSTRIRIINALSHSELCVCDIANLLGMTQSAISHQLRLLRSLRLVTNRKEGNVVYYSLADDHIASLFTQGLEHASEERF